MLFRSHPQEGVRTVPRRWRTPGDTLRRASTATRHGGADVFGATLLLQLTPHSRLLLAIEPVAFRTGRDGLAAGCRKALGAHPLRGAVSVVRNPDGPSAHTVGVRRPGLRAGPPAPRAGPLPLGATRPGRQRPPCCPCGGPCAVAWAAPTGPDGAGWASMRRRWDTMGLRVPWPPRRRGAPPLTAVLLPCPQGLPLSGVGF